MLSFPSMSAACLTSQAVRGLILPSLPAVAELLGCTPHFRQLSTQPSSPSFKAQTRALLKLVHPDQFHQHPEARDANERSFKLLQEYLAAAKTGGGIGRTAGLPYHFTFFIHQEQEQGSSADEDDGAAAELGDQPNEACVPEPFRRVSLTLPPPIKSGPGDELSPSTRKAFSRLLNACGIPDDAHQDAHSGGHRVYSKMTSLREFVPLAAEQVHQAAAQAAGPRQQLGAVRTALRLGRNVVVTWGEPLASGGVLPQLEAARQLLGVLDGLPELDVAGLRFRVGDAYGVDALGTIWLHGGDSHQAWERYISQVDTLYCRGRQSLLRQMRAQEAAVARALHLHLVYTLPQLSLDPPYLAFLERTAAAAAERGVVGGGTLGDVPLMVHPDPSQALDADVPPADVAPAWRGGRSIGEGAAGGSQKQEEESVPWLDEGAGVVCVPVSIPPPALYAALRTLGPRAQALLRAAREEDAQAVQLRKAVERKLRLRSVAPAGGLPPPRFRAACLRLMHHSGVLTPLLEGLAVRVGEVNGLPPDRSYVEIAWDFEV